LLSFDADSLDLCAKTDDVLGAAVDAVAAEDRGKWPCPVNGGWPAARRNVARHGPAPSSLHICATDP